MSEMSIVEQEKLVFEAHASFRKLPVEELFSAEPTNYICILNLGFGGDEALELDTIQELVSQILGAERVIANKEWVSWFPCFVIDFQPYIYVAFPRPEFSINAKEELNHQAFAAINGRVLFVQYVKEPEVAYWSRNWDVCED